MSGTREQFAVPPPLVALAGWVLPGAGYLLIGHVARALTVCVTILVLFVLGLLIGGVRVVDPPARYDRPLNAVLDKPWYIGQVLAGPVTLLTSMIGAESRAADSGRSMDAKDPADLKEAGRYYWVSHARSNEVGTLYTAVAGMLNLLTIIDSAYRAGRPAGAGGSAA
jgi:hypothetical protein